MVQGVRYNEPQAHGARPRRRSNDTIQPSPRAEAWSLKVSVGHGINDHIRQYAIRVT